MNKKTNNGVIKVNADLVVTITKNGSAKTYRITVIYTTPLKNGDKVRVRQSKFVTKLVRLSKKSFCEILDSKMGAEARKHEK